MALRFLKGTHRVAETILVSFYTWAVVVGALHDREPDWAAGSRHIERYVPSQEQFVRSLSRVPATVRGLAVWAYDFDEDDLPASDDDVIAAVRTRLKDDLELLRRTWDEADKGRIGNVRLLVDVADEDNPLFSQKVERLAASRALDACGLCVPA